MPITIDWPTSVINVPQSYLTLVGGTLYTMDTETFREDLKALEDNEQGVTYLKTHLHNTTYEIAGITYARAVQIIAPYTVTFEDGQYSVVLEGSNNNIWDVAGSILNQNQVQVIPTNSAGLIVKAVGSGMSQEEHDQLMALPTVAQILAGVIEGTYTLRAALRLLLAFIAGKTSGAATTEVTFRDTQDSVDRIVMTVDDEGDRSAVTLDES